MALLDKLQFWKKKEENFDLGLSRPAQMPGEERALTPGLERTEPFEKEFGLEPGFGEEEPMPMPEVQSSPGFNIPSANISRQMQRQQPMQQNYPFQQAPQNRDIELITAKLDAIRAMLENINQRLVNIERIAKESEHETY